MNELNGHGRVEELRRAAKSLERGAKAPINTLGDAVARCDMVLQLLHGIRDTILSNVNHGDLEAASEEVACALEQVKSAPRECPEYGGSDLINIHRRLEAATAIAVFVLEKYDSTGALGEAYASVARPVM